MSAPLPRSPADLATLRPLLGDVPVSTEETVLRRKSRDYYWFSPVLSEALASCRGDLVASPRNEAEVIAVAAACARARVPLVTRGAGTGNYGQSVPLAGGVILETTGLDRVLSIEPGRLRAQAGCRVADVEEAARASGQELHMHPSTKKIATIGGYFAGGSGGIGSVTFGGLREPGNLLGARVVSVEEEPRVIELEGADTGLVNRTFGSTGIVTEVVLPLAPARDWIDTIATFRDFEAAAACGLEAARDTALHKRLMTPLAASIADLLAETQPLIPAGQDLLIALIAEESQGDFARLVARHGGEIVHRRASRESETDPRQPPLYEFAFGHTTLHALKADRSLTYLQCLFPADSVLEKVRRVREAFGDELPMHIEFIRFEGEVVGSGVPLVRYRSRERLREIVAGLEALGVQVADPHVSTVEDGSRYKRVPGDQMAFKRRVDPLGLLNPGKMRSYVPARV